MTIKESANVEILRSKLDKDTICYLNSFIHPGVTHLDAVDFRGNADFLAPPWAEKYGLVVLSHDPKALSLAECANRNLESCLSSTIYAPYSLRKKWGEKWPKGVEFYYSKKGQEAEFPCVSCIDFEQGQVVRQQYEEYHGERCSIFASTPKGMTVVRSFGTEAELATWKESAEKSAEQCTREVDKAFCTKEKPYKIHLTGLDDSSYGLAFATQRDALQAIDDLHKYGYSYVKKNMRFTN